MAFEKKKVAKESEYKYELSKIARKFLPIEKERTLYKTMKKIFGVDPLLGIDVEMYKRGGYRQYGRKREFVEWGRKIAVERGIPSYNRALGIPLGQRALEPYLISGTDVIVDYDDLHHVNNVAIQQLLDDVKRTVILNLDIPHRVLQVRAGKEVTPETVNLYLETVQHTMIGGAVAQEHMAEIHPGLTSDAYAKVITGNDDIKDMLDRRFVIDIDELFHPSRAEQLKKAIGSSMWLVCRIPTIAVRMADGGIVHRWAAMQTSMALISAYRLTGMSVISDIAYAAKHARKMGMGQRTWYGRQRSQNEPGGIPYGFVADMFQGERDFPAIPLGDVYCDSLEEGLKFAHTIAESSVLGVILDSLLWYSFYMSGGIGFSTAVAAASYAGNVIEDFTETFGELSHKYSKKGMKTPPKWDTVRSMVQQSIQYTMEQYEKYPSLTEFHWGGAHRISLIGGIAGSAAAGATGSSILGLMGRSYAISLIMKEGWVRTGWAGQEVQDHVGLPYSCSFRIEEGGLPEFLGPNVPYISYTAGHGLAHVTYSAMTSKGRSWVCNPVIKVAFADPSLKFDFKHARLEIAKAALRQYMPAGERDLITPS